MKPTSSSAKQGVCWYNRWYNFRHISSGGKAVKLTDTFVKTRQKNGKVQKHADGDGLFLYITPEGKKSWRLAYRFLGKQKLLVIGPYPGITLKEARDKRHEARRLLSENIDPSTAKQEAKQALMQASRSTFEIIALEWLEKQSAACSSQHSRTILKRLENNIFPTLGKRPIRGVSASELLSVLRHTESRGAVDMAHRLLRDCGRVFRYAIATGRTERDIAADLRGALRATVRTNYVSITDPKKIGALLCALEGDQDRKIIHYALRLAPYLFVRPGELVSAEWAEFDLEAAEWRIPAAKMKMRQVHIVPLSTQVIAILKELHVCTGDGQYLFPVSRRSKTPHLRTWALLKGLRDVGYDRDVMTVHGFRSMASTVLNEKGYNRDWIERQLAHSERNSVRAAYNYAEYLPERRRMMEEWANYLDTLRDKARQRPTGE